MIQAQGVNGAQRFCLNCASADTGGLTPIWLAKSYTKVTYRISALQAMMSVPGTSPAELTPMPQKLLDVFLLGRCSHEFSWPRRGADGQFYQVCLLCAAEYKYDWSTMRRTERVRPDTAEGASTTKRRQHVKKPTWVPRARRIKLEAPVRYRVKNLGTWSEGLIRNLSQSGVLLHGPQRFPENTLVEMVFEMPEEISGQKNSKVLCQGRIIRMKDTPKEGLHHEFAASILDYKFLH
jgi:hypothetical protein